MFIVALLIIVKSGNNPNVHNQNVNTILFSHKKERSTILCYNMDERENMLSERSQTKKATCYMIPLK